MTIPVRELADLAGDLAGKFALEPLLERILINAARLLHCSSGSICTIDENARAYRKEVDLDVGCRSGEIFSLDEGVTGAVARAGGAVTFSRYSAVPGGHLPSDDIRFSRAVLGVPIRLGSSLIGAFMVFGDAADRQFTDDDLHLLELFAIHAAVAIANSMLIADGDRVRIPRQTAPDPASAARDAALTARERQVRALVERGWPNKHIAAELAISLKTVEKHVAGILRKTGATNRTELASLARMRVWG
jgi:DNA-binding CsgD family transcriptional regulator